MPEIEVTSEIPPRHSPGDPTIPRCVCFYGEHLAWFADWRISVSGLTIRESSGISSERLCVCQEITLVDSSYDSYKRVCDVVKRQILEVFALDERGSAVKIDRHGSAVEPVGVECDDRCFLETVVSAKLWLVRFPGGAIPKRYNMLHATSNSRLRPGPVSVNETDQLPPMVWVHRAVSHALRYRVAVQHCGAPGKMDVTKAGGMHDVVPADWNELSAGDATPRSVARLAPPTFHDMGSSFLRVPAPSWVTLRDAGPRPPGGRTFDAGPRIAEDQA